MEESIENDHTLSPKVVRAVLKWDAPVEVDELDQSFVNGCDTGISVKTLYLVIFYKSVSAVDLDCLVSAAVRSFCGFPPCGYYNLKGARCKA